MERQAVAPKGPTRDKVGSITIAYVRLDYQKMHEKLIISTIVEKSVFHITNHRRTFEKELYTTRGL